MVWKCQISKEIQRRKGTKIRETKGQNNKGDERYKRRQKRPKGGKVREYTIKTERKRLSNEEDERDEIEERRRRKPKKGRTRD